MVVIVLQIRALKFEEVDHVTGTLTQPQQLVGLGAFLAAA